MTEHAFMQLLTHDINNDCIVSLIFVLGTIDQGGL